MFINKPPKPKSEEITSEVVCEKAGKHLILLVEDNQDNVLAIRALTDNKYELEVATDGPSGVSKAKEFLPDLILLDISLPIIDGFKVFDEIKKEKKLKNIPIIAVTASVMKGNREEMLKYGFDNYISKPVDNVIFNEMLTKYLNPGAGAS
jgi:CheY-like chemotaxis protein